MQIGKLSEEESVILQYVQARTERGKEAGSQSGLVRFPLELYRSCKGIFKRQRSVEKVLLEYCIAELYVKDVKAFAEGNEEEKGRSAFLKMLIASKNNITLYLSQIFVRLIILGLCVKLGEKQRSEAKSKIRQLVKQLQIELVVMGGKGLAETIIDELKVLMEEFGCMEFLEGVRSILQKCNTFHVLEWIEKQLEERRQNFEKKIENEQKKSEEIQENTGKKILIKRRVTVSNVDLLFQPQGIPLKEMNERNKSRETKENRRESKLDDQTEKPPLSLLAKKVRMSMGSVQSSHKKTQPRFIFKSNKKPAPPELPSCFQEQPSSPSRSKGTVAPQPQKPPSLSPKKCLPHPAQNEDSKTLCQQTPPRLRKSSRKGAQ